MIRETLAANAKQAGVFVTPTSGVSFVRRSKAGGSSSTTTAAGTAPHWVKLVRSGNTFTAYRSADGVKWTLIGSSSIPMNSTVYVGLAVTSHNNAAVNTATMDQVTIV